MATAFLIVGRGGETKPMHYLQKYRWHKATINGKRVASAQIINNIMKLIVDIGNTFCKLAVFDEDIMIHFESIKRATVNHISLLVKKFPRINSSILSSVALHDVKINELLMQLGLFIELNHKTPTPFIGKYHTPLTLGKDRIAIASAAATLYPTDNTLVIDAGTSVTYDFITSKNEHLGGSISPGLNMRLESLHNLTHKLPLIELPKYDINIPLIGNTTESSILSGVVNGLIAETESIINQYSSSFSPLKIIISGGDYKYFEKLVKSNIFATSNIVITGLKSILDFNEKK